jgi:hypothetical protein
LERLSHCYDFWLDGQNIRGTKDKPTTLLILPWVHALKRRKGYNIQKMICAGNAMRATIPTLAPARLSA